MKIYRLIFSILPLLHNPTGQKLHNPAHNKYVPKHPDPVFPPCRIPLVDDFIAGACQTAQLVAGHATAIHNFCQTQTDGTVFPLYQNGLFFHVLHLLDCYSKSV